MLRMRTRPRTAAAAAGAATTLLAGAALLKQLLALPATINPIHVAFVTGLAVMRHAGMTLSSLAASALRTQLLTTERLSVGRATKHTSKRTANESLAAAFGIRGSAAKWTGLSPYALVLLLQIARRARSLFEGARATIRVVACVATCIANEQQTEDDSGPVAPRPRQRKIARIRINPASPSRPLQRSRPELASQPAWRRLYKVVPSNDSL